MRYNIPRMEAFDMLPPIMPYYADLVIKKLDEEEIAWRAYFNPLATDIWITILFVAILISVFLTVVEGYLMMKSNNQSLKISPLLLLTNFWVALKANFGGKPAIFKKNDINQITLFTCLLVGSTIWIGYRASLISEFSAIKLKEPFNDLESLLSSDYRYGKSKYENVS